jgi:hypothetical protein
MARKKRTKASIEKGIMITPGELPRFLFTGKVKTGRKGQLTRYSRKGTFGSKPFGRWLFTTGERK